MVEPLNTKAWVLVPVEPTPEMVEAHYQAHAEAETVFADAQLVWAKMLSASPSLPAVDGGEAAEKSEALAREYRPTMDKDIVHAWGADAAAALSEAATLITTQQREIERLTKERDEALLCQQEIAAGTDKSATVARIIIAKNESDDRASAAESRVLSLEEEVKTAALHVEQLSELLKIIKEHWVDYDHIFSISVHEADTWLSGRQALSEGERR